MTGFLIATLTGPANSRFGAALSPAGDVDGDGYADIAIGAYEYDSPPLFNDAGKLYVYYGGPSGPGATANWTRIGSTSDYLGFSVGAAGDVDADGYSDLAAGARGASGAAGALRVYYGGNGGLPGTSLLVTASTALNFGASVASIDRNGDGFSDVAVGSDLTTGNDGRVWIAHGNRGGASDLPAREVLARQVDRLGLPVGEQAQQRTSGRHDVRATGWSAGGDMQVRLVLEAKPIGQSFDRTNTRVSSWSETVNGSVPLSARYDDLERKLYRWRARVAGADPRFPGSPWKTLSAEGGGEADFRALGAIVPGIVVGLKETKTGNVVNLTWSPHITADAYDVVRGSLGTLRSSAGNFATATTLCLANDLAAVNVSDPAVPAAANGFWYLARTVDAFGSGSYDETDAGLAASRDAEIAASGAACP